MISEFEITVDMTSEVHSEIGDPPKRRRRFRQPLVGRLAMGVSLLVLVVAILGGRGWRPGDSSPSANPPSASLNVKGMPISAEIEATYGIRFTLVDVTAAGGMIQLRYQVLDNSKTEAIHSADAAPYIVDGNGHKYADPGMVGHSHVGKEKSPGTTDYILLANAKGGVTSGSTVTIRIGDLELRNVPVL